MGITIRSRVARLPMVLRGEAANGSCDIPAAHRLVCAELLAQAAGPGLLKRQVDCADATEMLKVPVASVAPRGNSFEPQIRDLLSSAATADGGFGLRGRACTQGQYDGPGVGPSIFARVSASMEKSSVSRLSRDTLSVT
jgi:hypothetical protein